MKKTITTVFLILFISTLYSQTTIWLIDARVIQTNKCGKIDNNIEYLSKKGKKKYVPISDVFCTITGSDTSYFYDNEDYPLEKAKLFMLGQIDGKKYNNYYVYTGAFAAGVVAPVSFRYVGLPHYVSPVVPAGYIAAFSKINPKSKFCVIPEKYANNEDYIRGYKYSAGRKKIRNSSIFAVSGLVIGFGITAFL